MFKFTKLVLAAVLLLGITASCSKSYKYETVAGDPMGTMIYTLDNGLKVYMTVNKETPRIQTFIAVRNGGKNDPADNTGLAHYLEHIMFKGTTSYGTSDYAAEKPLLDQIEELYNVYRTKTDEAERRAIYHQIDSISYEASKIAIPNEYDKLMSIIGSQGSNASTSNDVTQYIEDIPSNQIDTWAKVQADRFKNLVVRGFHTELEAVYEEFNMYANEDGEKAQEALDAQLFKKHPYGSQTVIGTQNHLQNPSISAIKHQYATMYVPNNVAICASGDFDPDEFVSIIEKYFGDWKPNENLPEFKFEEEDPITSPIEVNITGTEAEFVLVAWRYPGASSQESEIGSIVGSILYNGMCGLIDLDINQQQKALGVSASGYARTDYGELMLEGSPKQGQSLEEVKALMLEEVAKLRAGEFDDEMIASVVNNLKLRQMRSLTSNSGRARQFVSSFINRTNWADEVSKMDRMSSYTKEDVMAWIDKYIGENNYVYAYKHLGENKNFKKIDAPKITPIVTNRDKESAFLTETRGIQVKPIEPVFVDYSKDMSKFEAEGLEVLYKKNEQNDIAELSFIFDEGTLSDPALPFAFAYVDYLSTPSRTAEQIATELYGLACNYSVRVGDTKTTVSISGLSENIEKTVEIMTDLLTNAQPNEGILSVLKADELKSRKDNLNNQRAAQNAIQSYVMYGPEYIKANTLPTTKLIKLTSSELLAKAAALMTKAHTILYYGPASEDECASMLASCHKAPEAGYTPVEKKVILHQQTPEAKVFIAPYKSRQVNYMQYSCRGEKLDPSEYTKTDLYNSYFGSGMNAIVFQEMREARALAYSARAAFVAPSTLQDAYSFNATIGTQNDKLQTAVEAFDLIINDMPESDKAFDIAKTNMISNLRTNRVTGSRILQNYLSDRELGLTEPKAKAEFAEIESLTLEDLKATQQKWIKDRTYVYGLLGDPTDLDQNFLKTLGPVKVVSLEEVFGY